MKKDTKGAVAGTESLVSELVLIGTPPRHGRACWRCHMVGHPKPGKLLGAEIDPTDTRTLVRKVYEEFEKEQVEVIDGDDEQALDPEETETQEVRL